MTKKLKFFSGFIIFLIGLLVLMQASDLNPLLFVESYVNWLNSHYSLANKHFFLAWFLPCIIGGLIIMTAGFNLMELPKKEKLT